jgi:hypothetical protein
MPKGWLCDRGESGSERRAKPRRHVVSSACLLSICVVVIPLTEAKDHRPARKGVND